SKPLLETSQTVSVITREQIDDTASKTVQQAMRYTPGIFTGQVAIGAAQVVAEGEDFHRLHVQHVAVLCRRLAQDEAAVALV
ncbi:TonB-dependent receptor plug domain-containing protein, partial [Pseudomonas aeruginosa]|uniref:TonB-dependent receptor plug domain-containing protein n=1 Tax=Pseudomonas aeruginosa TaxID=287 RepID=UPI0020D10E2D